MIIADYENLMIPEHILNQHWEKALAWLRSGVWKDLPDGRVEIDGTGAYATISRYQTKPKAEGRYETHRVYADIQMLIEGTELVELCKRQELEVSVPYSPEKDLDFLAGEPALVHSVILGGKLAAVFFPADAHKPCLMAGEQSAGVRKLVIKVRLD